MAHPKIGDIHDALGLYVAARIPEYTTAACSALRLHSSRGESLARTHILLVRLRYHPTERIAAHAFEIFEVVVVPIPEIDALLARDFGLRPEVPISKHCTLEGLNTYHSLIKQKGDSYKFMIIFTGAERSGAIAVRLRGVAKPIVAKANMSKALWAAQNDTEWLGNLKNRVLASTTGVDGALSERDVMRRKLVSCDALVGFGRLLTSVFRAGWP